MPSEDVSVHPFTLNSALLRRRTVNAVRWAFGLAGAVAVITGVFLLIWPERTVTAAAAVLGIYFISAGVIRVVLSIFSDEIGTGPRLLNILFGVLLLFTGALALKNLTAAAGALLVTAVALVATAWVLQGVLAIAESAAAPTSWWGILYGAASLAVGVVILLTPATTAVFILVFSAVALIGIGVIDLIRAVRFGRHRRRVDA